MTSEESTRREHARPDDDGTPWSEERRHLLGRRISDLSLQLQGTPVEKLVDSLYQELGDKGLAFRPPVYLSDEWGCPDGTPLIGVPFYLADPQLARIEEEMALSLENEREAMRYLRHEAGHAFNYAYRLYDRPDWHQCFGPYSRPYRDRYRADPLSRAHVRHILGWYAQKHPDEDFAETFAVWLTPGSDWRVEYAGWDALAKLEYVDALMREVAHTTPVVPPLSASDMPVDAMHYTLAEHYEAQSDVLPIADERHFDGDLRALFGTSADAPIGEAASEFIARHRREIVTRLAYWTGEVPHMVRQLVDLLAQRAAALDLRVRGLEAATLVELTAFATAVLMNYRYSRIQGRGPSRVTRSRDDAR